MNVLEGSKRMQRAGRIMLTAALSTFTFFVVVLAVGSYMPMRLELAARSGLIPPFLFEVIWLSGVCVLTGAVLWLSGWIIEGFAQRPDHAIEESAQRIV